MPIYSIQPHIESLIAARKRSGLTQHELAKLLRVPQSYIARYESGKTDMRISRLIEIARVLNLEVTLVPRRKLPSVEWAMDEEDFDFGQRDSAAYVPDEDDLDEDEEWTDD